VFFAPGIADCLSNGKRDLRSTTAIHANFIAFLLQEPRLKRSLTHHSVAL
jgi:hypothetical protein